MNKKSVYLCMLLMSSLVSAQTNWTTVGNLQINVSSCTSETARALAAESLSLQSGSASINGRAIVNGTNIVLSVGSAGFATNAQYVIGPQSNIVASALTNNGVTYNGVAVTNGSALVGSVQTTQTYVATAGYAATGPFDTNGAASAVQAQLPTIANTATSALQLATTALQPTGNGSQLTGISAAQVGAVSTNDTRYLAALTNAGQFATAAQGSEADNAAVNSVVATQVWTAAQYPLALTNNNAVKVTLNSNLTVAGSLTVSNGIYGSGANLSGITAAQVGAVSNNDARYLAALTNAAQFATAAQGALASTALQPTGNGSQLNGITVSQVSGALSTSGSASGLSGSPSGADVLGAASAVQAQLPAIANTATSALQTANSKLSTNGSGAFLTGITATQVGAVATTNTRYLAALTNAAAFATFAQGAKADTALQSEVDTLDSVATRGNTTTNGVTIDAANQFYNTYGGFITVLGSSVQEGDETIAGGSYSHAEGYLNAAYGNIGAHVEGAFNNASGAYGPHAEGLGTAANGDSSHAEGAHSVVEFAASGSHAAGYNGYAHSRYCWVWNGDETLWPTPYADHGGGTFNVNPLGGLSGFYIGESSLASYFGNYVSFADTRYLASITDTLSLTGSVNVITAQASGGFITYTGGREVHTFLNSGTFTLSSSVTAQVLVVAGGGGGGADQVNGAGAGGGGAGGAIYSNSVVFSTAGTYMVTVGVGGSGGRSRSANNGSGNNGSNSIFNGWTAIGGGTGCGYGGVPGNGGSGGGAAAEWNGPCGTGTVYQGNNGAPCTNIIGLTGGGGGGGYSSAGLTCSTNGLTSGNARGGLGGAGLTNSISGFSATYANGGNGGAWSNASIGVSASANGAAETGNGGAGSVSAFAVGGSGGSGVVIISIPQLITTNGAASGSWTLNNQNAMYTTNLLQSANITPTAVNFMTNGLFLGSLNTDGHSWWLVNSSYVTNIIFTNP